MSQLSRRTMWVGSAVSVLALGGLAVYLMIAGLDDADKLGSVLSAAVGAVALVVTVLSMRTPGARDTSDVRVGGVNVTQINHASGNQQHVNVQPPK